MQATQKIFIGFIAFCAMLGAALGTLLYVSLIPHFGIIGDVATGVLIFALGCVAALLGAFTWHKIGTWFLNRNVIAVGDYLVYRDPKTGLFTHLSGIHHQMALPPQVVQALPSPDPRWDAVLELRKTGKGMHAIAKELKVPYNRVRTFLNQVEGNDDET